jgi:hypothetical protein
MWNAPRINRWVRRTFVTRVEKRLRSNTSEKLMISTEKSSAE